MIDYFLNNYKIPFTLRTDQEEDINYCSAYDRVKILNDVGLGKTVVSTAVALIHALAGEIDQVIVIMPPVLIDQWEEWILKLSILNGGDITVTKYKGTPAQRKKLDMNADFILMSMQIMKRDYHQLKSFFGNRRVEIIIDEATSIRRPGTDNFKKTKQFSDGNNLQLLSGTPIDNPMHAYGFIKLITPNIYRNMGQFKNVHVAKYDFWNKPCGFCNLDLLNENLMIQAVQRNAEDCLNLPEITYMPIYYELSKKHYKLYQTMLEEQLLVLEDKVIDVTDTTRLYHQSQQLVMSPQKFSDDKIIPNGYQVVDSVLNEMAGSKKLIIFSNYRLTNEQVYEYLRRKGRKPVLIYGGLGDAERSRRMKLFLHGTKSECDCLVGSSESVGVGLNLQNASSTVLFMETPRTSSKVIQALGRIHREGQEGKCIAIFAVAKKTIQETVQRRVVDNDDLVQEVFPTPKKLREMVYGDG